MSLFFVLLITAAALLLRLVTKLSSQVAVWPLWMLLGIGVLGLAASLIWRWRNAKEEKP